MKSLDLKSISNCELCKNAPCIKGCPLNNDIPRLIRYASNNNYRKAFLLLKDTNPFASICGRCCPHYKQCIGACIKDNVNIGDIEAFIGDNALKERYKVKAPKSTKYNVAIVGGGPSGLSCAYFLRKNGIGVTIYEKYDYLGGLLMHGIPDFRLSKDIVTNVTNNIINMGINVVYNKELGKDISLTTLKRKHDAVYIAIGANKSNKLHIKGEKLNGVYGGNELLEKKDYPNFKDKKVVICGGGNVSIDVARTVKRLEASNVLIIYRRTEQEMSADINEIKEAKKEGIEFLFNTNIKSINGRKNVTGVTTIKTESRINRNGKKVIENIPDAEEDIKCSFVIRAIGSHVDSVLRKLKLNKDSKGKIDIDKWGITSDKKVFAGGDVAGTKSTIAWATRAGRNAANMIEKYLEGNVYKKAK